MNKKEIAAYIDHTALKAYLTSSDIVKLCREALSCHFKSVCVNPVWVELAKKTLKGSGVLVCAVIGFPLGANMAEVKVHEARLAFNAGADEVDMVINIGKLKENDDTYVFNEIRDVVLTSGGKPVKAIIEACYLTDKEKERACLIASRAGATFVKTSTGFGSTGATEEDVKLMRRTIPAEMQVKASGGIRSYAAFKKMIAAGATRIGTSSGIKIIAEGEEDE